MTITARSSKLVLNQDMSVAWTSQPIRLATLLTWFFIFQLDDAHASAGTFHIEYAIDFNDLGSAQFTPLVWCPSGITYVVAAGLFTNTLNYGCSDQLNGAIGPITTGAEAVRIRWAPTGGSAGSCTVQYHAKSLG